MIALGCTFGDFSGDNKTETGWVPVGYFKPGKGKVGDLVAAAVFSYSSEIKIRR